LNKAQQHSNVQHVNWLSDDAIIAENKVLIISAQNADLQDHKEVTPMGEVIAVIRLMPDGVISDEAINKMIEDIKNVVQPPVKLGKIEINNVAFGLKGLNVTVSVPDSEGGLDPIVDLLASIENVDNAEVTDVGRV